ncbi:MAG: hypothetical protein R2744_08690 [Bacteroidales bacterium]
MVIESIGVTAEGRQQYMAIISSLKTWRRDFEYKEIATKLACKGSY